MTSHPIAQTSTSESPRYQVQPLSFLASARPGLVRWMETYLPGRGAAQSKDLSAGAVLCSSESWCDGCMCCRKSHSGT